MDNMTNIRFCNLCSCVIIAEGVKLLRFMPMKRKQYTKEGNINYEF